MRLVKFTVESQDGRNVVIKARQDGKYPISHPFWRAARREIGKLPVGTIRAELARCTKENLDIVPIDLVVVFLNMNALVPAAKLVRALGHTPKSLEAVKKPFLLFKLSDFVFNVIKNCNCTIVSVYYAK